MPVHVCMQEGYLGTNVRELKWMELRERFYGEQKWDKLFLDDSVDE
jgi:hypothetical protein